MGREEICAASRARHQRGRGAVSPCVSLSYRMFDRRPVHGADAFRYLALGHKTQGPISGICAAEAGGRRTGTRGSGCGRSRWPRAGLFGYRTAEITVARVASPQVATSI